MDKEEVTFEELVERFVGQFSDLLEECDEYSSLEQAFSSGCLMIVSALIMNDGVDCLPIQLRAMQAALHSIARERGWKIQKGGRA